MAQKHLLSDIKLDLRHRELRPVYGINTQRTHGPGGRGWILDVPTTSGRDNLAQAVIMRLLIPQGDLEALGHPLYGSRLHEFVGRLNNETTRNLMRLRILESLKREPRIEEIIDLTVTPVEYKRSTVAVNLAVLPVGETDIVTIGPLTLEL